MKNIILIGNGFDLAHNLKTSYNDFITYLGNQAVENPEENIITIQEKRYINPKLRTFSSMESSIRINNSELIIINSKNSFLLEICKEIGEKNWCDIERLYFRKLNQMTDSNVETLNNQFQEIKLELERYLMTLEEAKPIESFKSFFNEISNSAETLCLNFNYTNTLELLYSNPKIEILNIHGKLNNNDNPIIFGYSATEPENEILLKKDNNEFLKNIKRYHYNRLPIDRSINNYLKSNEQLNVYIMGHSCGTPDTNILDTIFSTTNLRSIEIFYHKNYNGYFESLVNIRRILSKKENFDKVTNYETSFKCPQYNDESKDIIKFKQTLDEEILTLKFDAQPKLDIR